MAKKTPEIRFLGFSDDWEQRKLEDMVTFFSGLTYSPNNIVEQSGTWVIRSSNIQNGEIVNADNVYVNSEIVNSDNVQVGDIVVVVRNGSRRLIGKHATIRTSMKNTVIGAFMTGIRSDTPSFINALLDTSQFEIEIRKNLGATINQITTGNFKKMTFNFSTYDERVRMGLFFKHLNNTIALQQRKLEALKQLKKGFLQKMFPSEKEKVPQLRFAHFHGEWEQCKLKEVGDIQSGIGFPNKEQGGTYGIPFYKVSDMNNIGNENHMFHSNNYISQEQVEKNNWRPIVKLPAVIFAKVGAALMLNRKRFVSNQFLIDNNMMAYSFGDSWNADFGFILFQTLNLPKYAQVGALPSFNASDIESIKVMMPCKKEQAQIGNFFKQLDDTIAYHDKKLQVLSQSKKAFLQKMFV